MVTFSQFTGAVTFGGQSFQGYAGNGAGKNNPSMQDREGVGPLPRGIYDIVGEPFVHPRCGQYCLRLEPRAENEMFGRAGFLWHGDSIDRPGTASHGCIVSSRASRQAAWTAGERVVEVVE